MFADWFLANADRISASVENSKNDRQTMLSLIIDAEAQLALVYRDGYKDPIEYDYCGKGDDRELNLYHHNDPLLVRAAGRISDVINGRDGVRWKVNTSK